MKTILLATLLVLSGSATMAAGKIVCTNKTFTFDLTPASPTLLNLKITSVTGKASVYTPKVGEISALTVDAEVSQGKRVILRSEMKQGEHRGYEFNMVSEETLPRKFTANINVGREGSDAQFASYSAECVRK